MRLNEFTKKSPILKDIIENMPKERKDRIKQIVDEYSTLIGQGKKTIDDLYEYIEKNYEDIK